MKSDLFEQVDMRSLRIGMYVELGMGWLSHPFPTGSFKVSTDKQLDTIRGLGLVHVRVNMTRSDAVPVEHSAVLAPVVDAVAQEQALLAQREQLLRRQRADQLAAEQLSLAQCEKCFGEAAQQYRNTLELLPSQPKEAAQQCLAMVDGMVSEMLRDGESAIRLLSESAGDKASMHPVNVTIVALLLGKAMGLVQADLMDLGMAAFLHDAGKAQLPEWARYPEDTFSSTEYKQYQEHVSFGVQAGKAMGLRNEVLLAIAQHHELVDGSGFPTRVKGESMTAAARILALVNRYDNLCNPIRPAAALTPHESLALIFSQLKTRFDSAALSTFIRMMGVYPPGSVVQLIDERYGLVVSVNSARPLKPRLIIHEPGVARHEAPILNLELTPSVGIRRSIKPATLPSAAMDFLAPRQRVCYYFEPVRDPLMAATV